MKTSLIHQLRAFTLVELIVVITIVGILSTVGFVSYSGYLTGARDSNRISQLTKLSDSLQVYSTTKSLPLPDDNIQIEASGSLVGYQGYVGVDVLETIDYTNGGKDPKDGEYFSYYLTKDRTSMQLLAFMEEENSTISFNNLFSQTNAADYSERFPKVYGRKLGILTQVDTNTPAQEVSGVTEVDLVTETSSYVAHISDEEKLEGAASVIKAAIPNGSCNRIKQTGGASGNGIYTINPGGTGEVSVYCNMETAGGGWTLIARSVTGSPMTWGVKSGDISNDEASFVYGPITNLFYSQVMIVSYSTQKDVIKFNSVDITSPLTAFSDGTHTLSNTGISGGTLSGPGMMFIK